MIILRLEAPFATFRTFSAGSFRPAAGFITISAAYGLLLNVAGIDMRHDDGQSPMTLIGGNLPRVKLAIAALKTASQHSIYQQLHNYPVGSQGKERKSATKGSKYNISPTRRTFLSDLKAYIALDGNTELESWVLEGLHGARPRKYGLPFLGDSNFLIDRFESVAVPQEAYWYIPLSQTTAEGRHDAITRLTITIDRANMSNTTSALFAPLAKPQQDIPETAWVEVVY